MRRTIPAHKPVDGTGPTRPVPHGIREPITARGREVYVRSARERAALMGTIGRPFV